MMASASTWPVMPAALLAGLCAATPAAAQTVGGRVLDDRSKEPVAGAVVSLELAGRRVGSVTDARGAFVMPLAGGSGRYVLRVEHPAYLFFADTLELHGQEAVMLEVRLGRGSIALQPLVVKGRMDRRLQGYRERLDRGSGVGRFVTRAQMDRMYATRASDFLRLVPGVQQERVNGGTMITMNNPLGNCTPIVFIDGMALEQRGPDDIDDRLDPRQLEGIEVYPGTAGLPLEFASAQPTGCGVVAFWTSDPGGRPLTWAKFVLSVGAIGAVILASTRILF